MRQGQERIASDEDGENQKMNILHPVVAIISAETKLSDPYCL